MEFRIRKIPDDQYRLFKILCIQEGKMINEKFLELIQKAVAKANGGKP